MCYKIKITRTVLVQESICISLKNWHKISVEMIENGVWKAHEKLPSLREQTQLSGYSLMTVLNAYQELEAQGLVYAKDKSGYYVAEHTQALLNNKQSVQIGLNPKIQINSVVFNYLKSTQSAEIVPFGSAFPNAELLYNAKFMQILAQQAKEKAVITTRIICRPAIRTCGN